MKLFMKSGMIVDLTDIDPSCITLEDIAHNLSNSCRFNGGCNRFYSIAEHSVNVSTTVADKHAKAALMHDAHEAYTGDIVRPILEVIDDTDIRYLRRYFNVAIAKRFYMVPSILECKEVLESDNTWLHIEGALFFSKWEKFEHIDYAKYYPRIQYLKPEAAKKLFLERFSYVQSLHV